MKDTYVQGSLSTLLRGLPRSEKIIRSLEGKLPIRDSEDQIIGYVTRIDLKNDTWYGRITENDILDPKFMSMELKEN